MNPVFHVSSVSSRLALMASDRGVRGDGHFVLGGAGSSAAKTTYSTNLNGKREINFSELVQRIGAEYHDASKVIGSIQLLSVELGEVLAATNFSNDEAVQIVGCSNIESFTTLFDSFCKRQIPLFVDWVNDTGDSSTAYKRLFEDMIFVSAVKSFTKFKTNLNNLHEKLLEERERNQSPGIQSAIDICLRLDDMASVVDTFLSMIKKFDLGYRGEPRPVNINDLIRSGLLYFECARNAESEGYLSTQRVADFDKTSRVLPDVLIDPDLPFKIWLNCWINAIEACKKARLEHVSFTISAEVTPCKNWVEIRIQDKGPGINQSRFPDPNQILEKGQSTSTKKENRGLGGYISKQIVEAAGGNIHVESQFGKDNSGTTIVIRLPAIK